MNMSQAGPAVLMGFGESWTEGTQGDQHHLAAVVSYKTRAADECASFCSSGHPTHISRTDNRETLGHHFSQLVGGHLHSVLKQEIE